MTTDFPGADNFLPPRQPTSLQRLKSAAAGCQGCDLYLRATQTVFGAGPRQATLMLVGEQPGDAEDQAGKPFVGPAGGLLRSALTAAGIESEAVYVSNAVKHFRWTPAPGGKKRLHAKPSARQIAACSPWLWAEIASVKPQVLVLLGLTASQALLGPNVRVSRDRGKWIPAANGLPRVLITVHPASILRTPKRAQRQVQLAQFIAELKLAALPK